MTSQRYSYFILDSNIILYLSFYLSYGVYRIVRPFLTFSSFTVENLIKNRDEVKFYTASLTLFFGQWRFESWQFLLHFNRVLLLLILPPPMYFRLMMRLHLPQQIPHSFIFLHHLLMMTVALYRCPSHYLVTHQYIDLQILPLMVP